MNDHESWSRPCFGWEDDLRLMADDHVRLLSFPRPSGLLLAVYSFTVVLKPGRCLSALFERFVFEATKIFLILLCMVSNSNTTLLPLPGSQCLVSHLGVRSLEPGSRSSSPGSRLVTGEGSSPSICHEFGVLVRTTDL
ncbi:unnamed protein product [Durusdinium trenchii]|uniref:Uncharacterized protein n=1 Tax=Durusdinium trenchii TaxID=1381693 RepID=A0ABP0SC20_9DINO